MSRTKLGVVTIAATLALVGCATNSAEAPPGEVDNLWSKAREVKAGEPWLIGMGDSFISGEGGRWASNGMDNTDIFGNGGWLLGTNDQAYGDAPNGTETIPYCHRSATAPSMVGSGWNVKNLACSGAMTTSFVNPFDRAKPGIDFAKMTTNGGEKFVGQAQLLQDFAKDHDVTAVALSIGGNDMGFSEIIATCLTDWIKNTACSGSEFIASRVNPEAQKIITKRVFRAIENVNIAMTKAGYQPDEWRLMLQLPPSPLPPSSKASYPDIGFNRQIFGGCGMLNADLDFANDTLLPYLASTLVDAQKMVAAKPGNAPMTAVDTKDALVGHRLCEDGTTRPDAGTGIPPNGFSQDTEWVRFISVITAELYSTSPEAQEAMHPTYFGQRTLSSCMREALNTPIETSGAFCTRNAKLIFNDDAQPAVTVTPKKLDY